MKVKSLISLLNLNNFYRKNNFILEFKPILILFLLYKNKILNNKSYKIEKFHEKFFLLLVTIV